MYKQAGAHQAAYELAINYLAPEAVLREDLDFLEDLFTKLDESLIPEFSVGGQVTYSIPSGRLASSDTRFDSSLSTTSALYHKSQN